MGWTEQIPNLVVIAAQSGGYTGLFIYDPAPGVNNLLASIAPVVGTDPYGNKVVGGGAAFYLLPDSTGELTFIGPRGYQMRSGLTYEGSHASVAQSVVGGAGGQISFKVEGFATNVANATDSVEIDFNSNSQSGVTGAQMLMVYTDATNVANLYGEITYTGFTVLGTITATDPTVATSPTVPAVAEVFKPLGSPSATGYTSDIGQYKFTAENELEIDVQLHANAGGGTAGTYTYANALPPPYRPPVNRMYGLGWDSTVTAGMSFPVLIIDASGTVQVKLPALGANIIVGGTFRVPLV